MPKKGSLSKEEKDFILLHYSDLTPVQIATRLNRTVESIKKFIIRQVGFAKFGEDIVQPTGETPDVPKNELKEIFEIIDQLRAKPEYKQLREEFSPDELKIFEHKYSKFFKQLKEDILASEEVQLFKAIKFDILMHRALKAQKIMDLQLLRLDKAAEEFSRKVHSDTATDIDRQALADVEQSITNCRQAQSYKIKEVRELNKEHEDLLRALKASREQRISRIENSKMSFMELIKQLYDEDFREREGRLDALTKLASKKELERLSATHQYMNGEVDQPILSSETVI